MDLRGRWPRVCVKLTVEQCLRLHVGALRDALAAGRPTGGSLAWPESDGTSAASVAFQVTPTGPGLAELRLEYGMGADPPVQEVIQVRATPQPFGGQRWHFLCPVVHEDGSVCGRRTWILFLAPAQRFFACSSCLDLTYQIRRQRRRRPDMTGHGEQLAETEGSGLTRSTQTDDWRTS